MSRRLCNITAWDVLDEVRVSLRMLEWDDYGILQEPSWTATLQYPSTGEERAHEWVRDTLVALLEAT